MSLYERAHSEQESASILSRTESSLSASSEPAGYEALMIDDDSDLGSSRTGDTHSIRESALSAVGPHGASDAHHHGNEGMSLAITRQEALKQIHLRQHIGKLKKNKQRKEEEVESGREELAACREHLESLQNQLVTLERRVEQGEGGGGGGGGVAAVGLLKAQLARVKGEIEREGEVEKELLKKLQASELQLSDAILACSQFEEKEEELKGAEKQAQAARNLKALQRLQSQTRMKANAERTRRAQERLRESTMKTQETQRMEMLEKARRAQEDGRAFLRETMERRKQEEAKKEMQQRQQLERRMKAVLSLKRNIESSEGTIQALQMLKQERDRKERELEAAERKQALLEGENPDEVILHKKRAKAYEKKKEEFEAARRQRHVEIVAGLLEERKARERAEKMASKAHWKGRWPPGKQESENISREGGSGGVRNKKLKKRRTLSGGSTGVAPVISSDNTVSMQPERDTAKSESSEEEEEEEEEEEHSVEEKGLGLGDWEETLEMPEIEGLWERRKDGRHGEGGGGDGRGSKGEGGGGGGGRGKSKMEQQMMATVIEKLKNSAVRTQVAAGREFKGCPFTSQPQEAVFKDFEPGQRLKLRLTLTNVSYTVNRCSLVGVTPELRDFVTVDFNPPGAMSAGLTCHMTVTFEPKLNQDLEGKILLHSQTGPFSIPVRCTIKRCVVSVDHTEVDFGKVCVGETVRKTVTLENDGALSTNFTFRAKSELQVTSAASVVDRTADLEDFAHSVTSVMSVMSDVKGRDWGALGRVKEAERPISRSTSDLPQLTTQLGKQSAIFGKLKKPDKPEKPVTPEKGSKKDKAGKNDLKDKEETDMENMEDRGDGEERGEGGGEGRGDKEGGGGEGGDVTAVVRDEGREGPRSSLTSPESPPDTLPPAITVGKVKAGRLDGYRTHTLELAFSPESVGLSSCEFVLSFSLPGVPPIVVQATGEGLDLPVFVKRESVDLKICTVGRLYQDSIEVFNRGVTAMRISFHLPPELDPHMEILPHHSLVQGSSSFSAQLKFLPQSEIFEECAKYFSGPDSNCLDIPVEIGVVDQIRTVPFTIHAQVTKSDLLFSCSSISFGSCTVHESVVASVEITNTSILAQEYGFVHLPECVDVQPGDGFGTILPLETISLDIIFSAEKPKDYSFTLTCLTGLDRTYKIPCTGQGVLPALKMSANAVNFAPTALNNTNTTRITLSNPRLSRLSSPVIQGAILPQGAKAFEFLVPEGVPITVSPRVGVIQLEETTSIELSFSPTLAPSAVSEEALRLATEEAKQKIATSMASQTTIQQPPEETEKKAKRHSSRAESRAASTGKTTLQPNASKSSLASQDKATPPAPEDETESKVALEVTPPAEGSELWLQAVANLLDQFENRTDQFSIPCFVSSEAPKSEFDTVPYGPEDTLYVEVTSPVIRPALGVVSNGARPIVDFTTVGTGDCSSKLVTVKNTSNCTLKLSFSPLDPHGPFEMRNSLRTLPPDSTHTLILKFSPQQGGKYYETLRLSYGDSSALDLRLVGEAVEPSVELEPDTDRIDLGHTFIGDTAIKKISLKNTSSLSVHYRVALEGQRRGGGGGEKQTFRAVNYNGQVVFDCIPFQGRIEAGGTVELVVSFSPDHQSSLYSDTLHIDINNLPTHTLSLTGQAWSNTMYILGGEEERLREESMAATLPLQDEEASLAKPVVVIFLCQSGKQAEREGEEDGVVRKELVIGCVKTPMVKKSSGDFIVEAIPSSNPHSKAFSFEPAKSSVEAGGTKTLVVSFHPPKGGSAQTIEASTKITLKGNSVQVYRLILKAILM